MSAAERMREIAVSVGRDRVFDTYLREVGLPLTLVPEMVWAYRTHSPSLSLFPDACDALALCESRGYRTGVITDGLASVQWRKIKALALDSMVDVIVCTDEIGNGYNKPSAVPFEIALRILTADTYDTAYVADDASKDFIGPNSLGIHTVQVIRDVDFGFSKPAAKKEEEAAHATSDVLEAVKWLFQQAG